jgi:hypothetical protein
VAAQPSLVDRTKNELRFVMSSPTESAEQLLRVNQFLLQARRRSIDNEVLGTALENISMALIELSVGLRATYKELEEIKRTMAQGSRRI